MNTNTIQKIAKDILKKEIAIGKKYLFTKSQVEVIILEKEKNTFHGQTLYEVQKDNGKKLIVSENSLEELK
jgi:hypothetical protein